MNKICQQFTVLFGILTLFTVFNTHACNDSSCPCECHQIEEDSLQQLPLELKYYLLSYLEFEDKRSMAKTSKAWNQAFLQVMVKKWKPIFNEYYRFENSEFIRNKTKLTLMDKGKRITLKLEKVPEVFNSGCRINIIDLSYRNIGDERVQDLSEALMCSFCKMHTLILRWNDIGAVGAQSLSKALRCPDCKLTTLDLGNNQIGDSGVYFLSEALQDPHCKLSVLYLGANNIGVSGAQSISKALMHSKCRIAKLDLVNNQIKDEGAQFFTQALQNSHCKLVILYLEDNEIGAAGVQALRKVLQNPNCKLVQLCLGENQLGTNEVAIMVVGMRQVSLF